MLNHYAGLGAAVAVIVMAACGDSTGPRTESASQLAHHIDSLAIQARTESGPQFRWETLLAMEGVVAEGAPAVVATVTTRSGAHVWQGLAERIALPEVYGYDSAYVVYAFSDYAMTNVLTAAVVYSKGTASTQATMLTDDSLWFSGGSGTVTGTTVAVGGACTPVQGLAYGPYGTPAPGSQCQLATLSASASWTFPASPEFPTDFQTIAIESQQFHAADFTGP